VTKPLKEDDTFVTISKEAESRIKVTELPSHP